MAQFNDDGTPMNAAQIAAAEAADAQASADAAAAAEGGGEAAPEGDANGAEGDPPADQPAREGKIRIGDQTFKTEAEAIAYAEAAGGTQVVDPLEQYRRGVQDTLARVPAGQKVTSTPEQKAAIQERLLTDPEGYLAERDAAVAAQVLEQVNGTQAARNHADAVWNAFALRHPDLADFQKEVNALADDNMAMLRQISATKGAQAGHDFIALKMRSNLRRYADASKPRKDLPNGKARTTPNGGAPAKGNSKETPQKPLSLREQLAKLKGVKKQ